MVKAKGIPEDGLHDTIWFLDGSSLYIPNNQYWRMVAKNRIEGGEDKFEVWVKIESLKRDIARFIEGNRKRVERGIKRRNA